MGIPSKANSENRSRDQKYRVGQGLHVLGAPKCHEGKAAENYDAEDEHQEDAVKEVDNLGRLRRIWLGGDECHDLE